MIIPLSLPTADQAQSRLPPLILQWILRKGAIKIQDRNPSEKQSQAPAIICSRTTFHILQEQTPELLIVACQTVYANSGASAFTNWRGGAFLPKTGIPISVFSLQTSIPYQRTSHHLLKLQARSISLEYSHRGLI